MKNVFFGATNCNTNKARSDEGTSRGDKKLLDSD